MMKKIFSLLVCSAALGVTAHAQLNIGTAQFFIQSGGVVTVQGDLTSNTDIQGTGKIVLKGSANQNVNMNGFAIPNLEMDNAAGATLTGNAKIGSTLLFTTGKITAAAFNLKMSDVATASGGGASKFVETNSTGQVQKDIVANLTNYEVPVGTGTTYSPVFLTTTGSNSGGVVGVRAVTGAEPNKHIRSTDFLTRYWALTRSGIGGTLDAKGKYANADVTGSEAALNGIFWNGTSWSLAGTNIDPATDQAGATISSAGDLYAMNKFVLSKIKVYLQAPVLSGGLMEDKLRTSAAYASPTYPASNLIPLGDPYRTAPYNTSFTHVNNTTAEVTTTAALSDQANPNFNVVDWVYVELRNTATPSNVVLQTRAALLRRDGTIVDIDNSSPLYFKDVAAGSYTLAVRHRNHLAMSTNPATFSMALDLPTPASTLDLTTLVASSLMGTAGSAYLNSGGINFMYGGNTNTNTNTRFNGLNNDKDFLLTNATYGLNNNLSGLISNIYSPSDVNMNRNVRFNGLSNDKDFILITVLGSNLSGLKTQVLPN